MLKELFEAISGQAVKASGNATQEVPCNDPTIRMFVRGNGEVVSVDLHGVPHRIVAGSLDDFVRLCLELKAVAVFVYPDDSGVTVHGELDWRNEESVVLPMRWHPLFRLLHQGEMKFDQRGIVRWLAQDMAGCVDPGLVRMLREVTQSATGSNQVSGVGRERGTREFTVEAAGELPETLTVIVPALLDFDLTVEVRMGLDVTLPPHPLAFAVRALPGQFEAAEYHAKKVLVEYTRGALDTIDGGELADKVYLGKPTDPPQRHG